MNRDDRTVREYALTGPADVKAAAKRLLGPKVSKMKPKSRRPAKLAKAAKRETRREKMAEIRRLVLERAGDSCEACGNPLEGAEVHHVISGSGRRRAYEAIDTCVALCRTCHHLIHRNNFDVLYSLLTEWGPAFGSQAARDALDDRLGRTSEPRRA